MLLDVGCRDRKEPNFTGIDTRKHNGVDIVHDLEKFPYPLKPESCLTIKCAHVVEHIKPWLFFKFMDELWRVLKFNGQLAISAPYAGSHGYWMDPSHCTGITEGSFQLLDPEFPLYERHKTKPWKVEYCVWRPNGNIEAILRKKRQ